MSVFNSVFFFKILFIFKSDKETEESEEQSADNDEDDDEDGEGKKKDSGQQGPWAVVDGVPQPPVTPKPSGKYRFLTSFPKCYLPLCTCI